MTQNDDTGGVIVEAVGEEPLDEHGDSSRFLLSLAGYQEPLSLVGKRTNAVEALFYEYFAPNFPHFTVKCYFNHIGLDEGWLVLADVHNDHAPETWNPNDIEILIGNLASLHASYWARREVLEQYGLPGLFQGYPDQEGSKSGSKGDRAIAEQPPGPMERIEQWLQSQHRLLTEHALRTAGPTLAPMLVEAGRGLETLRNYKGWPGIIDERHLVALADLLDDPVPILYPLRQLPDTLLHGEPSSDHWYLTLFDDYYLLDWQKMAIGPGVYDLVSFIDQVVLLPGNSLSNEVIQTDTAVETMIDSYILAMSGELGSRFDARSTRLAVPAARCLLVLIHWIPRLGGWLREMSYEHEVWQAMNELPDEALTKAGNVDLITWRKSLALIFDRFLRDYRRL